MMCFNVWSFLQVLHLYNEDIKPSAAFSCRHNKNKIHAPECTKTRHFYLKIQNFSGEGAQPLPRPLRQREGDTPSRIHPPRRLWRLDLRALGAHSRTPTHSEVWLWARVIQIKFNLQCKYSKFSSFKHTRTPYQTWTWVKFIHGLGWVQSFRVWNGLGWVQFLEFIILFQYRITIIQLRKSVTVV